MKITHINISKHIDFNLNNCYSLIIENSNEFFNLTNELYLQINGLEGNFVLSNNGILDISKNCLFIYDYYGDMFSSKKMVNAINNKALNFLKQNDFIVEFSQINKIFIDINEKLLKNFDENVSYNDCFQFEDFIKFSNYKIEKNNSLVNNLLNYINFCVENLKTSVVIFVNLFSVLNEEIINNLLKQLSYMQLNVLLINNQNTHNLTNVETIIIDYDLCVI